MNYCCGYNNETWQCYLIEIKNYILSKEVDISKKEFEWRLVAAKIEAQMDPIPKFVFVESKIN